LVARHVGAGDGLQLADLDVEVPAGARLVIVRSVEGEGRHLGRVRADVSGTLEVLSLVDARGTARVEVSARLGASARFDLGVLVRALDGAHVDHHAEVFHDAPGAVSRQVARGIVHDGGRSAFTGRVEVAGGAMGTDARQSVRHLLLGSRGRVDARPWLAIRCDDVVCTHGATVGRLDAEALFLMRSRGLTEADARGLLLGAFAREVLERLPDGAADLGRVSSWD
jgi:Fe-S cluster assembly protein SufD